MAPHTVQNKRKTNIAKKEYSYQEIKKEQRGGQTTDKGVGDGEGVETGGSVAQKNTWDIKSAGSETERLQQQRKSVSR